MEMMGANADRRQSSVAVALVKGKATFFSANSALAASWKRFSTTAEKHLRYMSTEFQLPDSLARSFAEITGNAAARRDSTARAMRLERGAATVVSPLFNASSD